MNGAGISLIAGAQKSSADDETRAKSKGCGADRMLGFGEEN